MYTMRPAGRFTDGLISMIDYVVNTFNTPNFYSIAIAELGSFAGESSRIFAAHPGVASVECFDLWPVKEVEDKFDALIKRIAIERNAVIPTKIKMNIETEYNTVRNNKYDFIYIDANHTYEATKANIINWYPKLKDIGIMGGHDYNQKDFSGVVKAVNEMFHNRNVIFFPDSSWVVGKYKELK